MPTRCLVIMLAAAAAAAPSPATGQSPPPAPRSAQVDTLHGVPVPAPYRWLEAMDSAPVQAWVRAQDAAARAYAAGAPDRAALEAAVREAAETARYGVPVERGGRLFLLRFPASGPGPGTTLLAGPAGSEPVPVLTPSDGVLTQAVPSPDGTRVAYLTTDGASRWATLRIRDLAAGTDLPDRLTGLSSGASTVVWAPDGRALYYERFPARLVGDDTAPLVGERLHRHTLGTAQAADPLVYAPADEGIRLATALTPDGRWLVVATAAGTEPGNRVLLLDAAGAGASATGAAVAHPLVGDGSATWTYMGALYGRLFFQTDADAPRGRIAAVAPRAGAVPETVVPEAEWAITNWLGSTVVGGRLLVAYLRDAVVSVRAYHPDGRHAYDLAIPGMGSLWTGFAGTEAAPAAHYVVSGAADPGTVYRLDVASGRSEALLRPVLPYDPAELLTEQVFYTARDGTRIPMYVVRHPDVPLDGSAPAFMYGYGFGWAAAPWFQPFVAAWVRLGGVWALPNTRGGTEYGEAWHRAGMGAAKQTVIDDYVDAARWLVANGYTSADRMVANASSAGGVVAGAAIVQHPDLFAAAVLDYPLLDMLRYDRFSGAHQWRFDYGSAADAEAFRWLRSYSPQHNVAPATCYPATLVAPGERDPVTPALHAYKFVAALQHAQACSRPVHLRVAWGAGHSAGRDLEASIGMWTDQLAFLRRVLPADAFRWAGNLATGGAAGRTPR